MYHFRVMSALRIQLMFCIAASHAMSVAATAQPRSVTVPYRATCAQCRITLTPIVTLGKSTDSVQLGEASQVARDSRGLLYATAAGRNRVAVFDASGKLLRTIGRTGARPGEFGTPIRSIYVSRDSLYVFDSDRMTVFAPSHTYARVVIFQVIPQYSAAIAPNGHIYFAANVRTTGRQGMPAHHADASGKILQSFGRATVAAPPAGGRGGDRGGPGSASLRPFVASFASGSIWYWDASRYRLEEWGIDGKSRAIVQVSNVPWLAAAAARGTSDSPPPATRASIDIGGVRQGLLFVNATVPLPGARAAAAGSRGTAPTTRTLLEVIDAARGQLVYSQQVDAPLMFFPDSDHAYGMIRDKDGNISFRVWRVELAGYAR